MQNYSGAHSGAQFILYVGLTQQADTKLLQVNPTIAAGDFKVSTNGGAFADLTTLPTVTPAGGRSVKITLSAAEMTGANVMVMCVDAAGAEWCDLPINIQTTPLDASLVQVDGTANASATLSLKQISVVNNAGSAIVATSTGSNGDGITVMGNGSGSGMKLTGGATAHGLSGNGGSTSGHGIFCQGVGMGTGLTAAGVGDAGIACSADGNNPGMSLQGRGSGEGLRATGGLTGHGIKGNGGATSGAGILGGAVGSGNGIQGNGTANGSGIYGTGNGTGAGIIGQGGATGNGIQAVGGSSSGNGIVAAAVGGGVGIIAGGVGSVSLLATQGISGPLDTSTYNAISDNLLTRDWTVVGATAARSVLNALRFLRNRWAISGTTLTVSEEDDVTPAFTATLTTDATADPVVIFNGN